MTKTHSHIFRPLFLAAFIASLSACGGGGDSSDSGGSGGGGTQQPVGTLAGYAGQYDLRTDDGTVLRITVDQNGRVTSCGAAYTCEGTLALKPGGQGAGLTVSGSDGQGASSVRVSMEAAIDSSGRVSGSWSAQSSEGQSSGSLSGQKTPGDSGSGGTPTTTLSSFAGKYNLRADEGTTLQFTAQADGAVRSCVGATIYVCSGRLTLDPGGQGASFSISGTDGGMPVDTRVTLSGKIDLQGNVTGSYSGTSQSDGSFRGSLTGTREGGPSTAAPGSAQGCAALAGTWTSTDKGTWVFSGSKAVLTLDSINYGPRAQQITELALSSCTSSVLQYKIVRAALVNTVDPSFAYDHKPGSTNAVDWNKSYSQPYTLSGTRLTIATDSYTRR